jgi:uncharacterized protein (DUF433 family)
VARVTASPAFRNLEEGVPTMASLDWSQCPAVESIPGKGIGAWVFKGTRLPVSTVIENLEDLSIDEVIENEDSTRLSSIHQLQELVEMARVRRRPDRTAAIFGHIRSNPHAHGPWPGHRSR